MAADDKAIARSTVATWLRADPGPQLTPSTDFNSR